MAGEEEKESQDSLAQPEEEALRLKTLAEEKYTSNNLKSALKYAKRAHKLYPSLDGLAEMLTAFKIIRTAALPVLPAAPESNSAAAPDYYKILGVERFSHINTIKKQYKKLALTLHPDKNPFVASEEAFKLVGEAMRVLSDKIRRKEYDMRLRIAMQSEAEAATADSTGAETFWTACSTCRLLHQFERKYLGHNLMCPNCKKSFKAVEVEENREVEGGEENEDRVEGGAIRVSARIQEKVARGEKLGIFEKFGLGVKRKISTVGEVLERSGAKTAKSMGGDDGLVKGSRSRRVEKVGISGGSDGGDSEGIRSKKVGKAVNTQRSGNSDSDIVNGLRARRIGGKVRNGIEEKPIDGGVWTVESGRPERAKAREEETMTLAQIKILAKKKKKAGEANLVIEENRVNNGLKPKEKESEKFKEKKKKDDEKKNMEQEKEKDNEENEEGNEIVNQTEKKYSRRVSRVRNLENAKGSSKDHVNSEIDSCRALEMDDDVEVMVVEKEMEKETENLEKEKEKEIPLTREKRERRRVSKYGNFELATRKISDKDNNSEIEETENLEKETEKEIPHTREKRERRRVSKYGNFEVGKRKTRETDYDSEIERIKSLKKRNLEIMPVEDSDFHDFDKDRRARSFRKGQVWAVYDDDDGMPRHYALIDEVISPNPFEVTLRWLQSQSNGDEELLNWEKMGSCGRFQLSRKISIKYLNLFSHVVDCERAAREVYRIYPKKGSVWALYNNNGLNAEDKDKRSYTIVVSLNTYSDTYGLSIAYLEKVDGFRAVFKRREIGGNAVILLGKDDLRLFSHQIPAKKLSGKEASGLPKDCWELDPASLTSQLLIGS